MIAWWWLLAVWIPLVLIAALRDGEVWNALRIVVCAAAALPLLPIVWVLTRLDMGAVPLDPRALEQFSRMRTVDMRPAFCFFTWKRGIIFLRRWEVDSDRRKVEIRVRDNDPLVVDHG